MSESGRNQNDPSGAMKDSKPDHGSNADTNMNADVSEQITDDTSDDNIANSTGRASSSTNQPSEESTTPQLSPINPTTEREQPKQLTKGNQNSVGGFFSLTKRKNIPPQPKIQSSGIVNYGVGQNSDSESDASSLSLNSVSQGYDLPFAMQSGYRNTQFRDPEGEDDASVRTPMPTGPPEPGAVLPSAFLRDRNNSTSNVSDLSAEEESSVVKRQKREAENVGRLVEAAKQQQSFAQAWFSAGNRENNALPKYVPPKKKIPSNVKPLRKKISFKDPERSTGPIDLDSGGVWEGDAEQDSKSNWEVGSFNFTTHSGTTKKRKNQGFINFGVPDDEDLTTYYTETRCCDRIVCTIGSTRCSLLALLIVAIGVTSVIIGGAIYGVGLTRDGKPKNSFTPPPQIPNKPSNQPSTKPSMSPSMKLSSIPSLSPSLSPSLQPSPSPTSIPSLSPSFSPSLQPSPSPTISQIPSMMPSSSPTTYFSSQVFSQVGEDLELEGDNLLDGFGESISISENGDIVAVGTQFEPNDRGSVTVYQLQTDAGKKTWVQMGNTIEGLAGSSQTGPSVDISKNGQTLIMGEQDPELYYTGTARVFSFNNDTQLWNQIGSTIQQEEENALFGHAVAISDLGVGNGIIVAVSSPSFDYCGVGKVTAYNLNAENEWQELATASSDPQFTSFSQNAVFGHSISLSSDGTVLACGAPGGATRTVDIYYQSMNHGYVQVLELDRTGTPMWIPRGQELIPYEGDLWENFSAVARFGESVSLSADGNRVAIGTKDDLIQSHKSSGSASVYEFNSSSYERIGDFLVGNPSSDQKFGQSVAISSDGMYVTVGARLSSFYGQVFVYRNNNLMWDAAQVIDGNQDQNLGNDVAIAVEKNGELDIVTVAAGGPFLGLTGKGVARVYESEIRGQP